MFNRVYLSSSKIKQQKRKWTDSSAPVCLGYWLRPLWYFPINLLDSIKLNVHTKVLYSCGRNQRKQLGGTFNLTIPSFNCSNIKFIEERWHQEKRSGLTLLNFSFITGKKKSPESSSFCFLFRFPEIQSLRRQSSW